MHHLHYTKTAAKAIISAFRYNIALKKYKN